MREAPARDRSERISCESASAAAIVGLLNFLPVVCILRDEKVVCISMGTGLRDPGLDSDLGVGSLAEHHAEFLERPAR